MMRRASRLEHILSRTPARIDQRSVPQLFPSGEIKCAPLALHIRAKAAADVRPFVPAQAEPAQVFDDGVAKFRTATHRIEILDPKNKRAAVLFGAFLRAPESDGVSDMEITGRRWGDPAAVGNFRFQIGDFRLA
jgi:hypothetical protein